MWWGVDRAHYRWSPVLGNVGLDSPSRRQQRFDIGTTAPLGSVARQLELRRTCRGWLTKHKDHGDVGTTACIFTVHYPPCWQGLPALAPYAALLFSGSPGKTRRGIRVAVRGTVVFPEVTSNRH